MRTRNRRSQGITIIELLIVVALIGLILGVLLPNLMDALNKGRQKRTIADMHAMATAMMSYYADMQGAAAAGFQVEIGNYDKINQNHLSQLLVPDYLPHLPVKDPWGYAYDYYFGKTTSEYGYEMAFGIRSRGRGGEADDFAYRWGAFPPTQYDRDIVWLDGVFVTWPGTIEGDVNLSGDVDCNQGVGEGGEGCDPGNSNQGNPNNTNDEDGGSPGDPGKGGGQGGGGG